MNCNRNQNQIGLQGSGLGSYFFETGTDGLIPVQAGSRPVNSANNKPSASRSDPSSFSYGSLSSSDSSGSESSAIHHHHKSQLGKQTPTSVLPSTSHVTSEISCDWPVMPHNIHFELVQAFKMIDKDGDGKISAKELEGVLKRVAGGEEELKLMISEIDRDGDGCISLEEFGAIGSAFGSPPCDSELREVFDVFDTDHDGRITAEELHAVFAAIGVDGCDFEDCRRMISEVDKNGDGFVCFEDFARMMDQQS
ncbi:hypothetical protein NMG60_11001680 [Bertholletia excelsa]